VPVLRHREAWAEEQRAPTRVEWERRPREDDARQPEAAPVPAVRGAAARADDHAIGGGVPRDVLVVVSKLKLYIRGRAGMNCSDGVVDVLSDRLRALCDEAIERARAAGRKTVLDRDFGGR